MCQCCLTRPGHTHGPALTKTPGPGQLQKESAPASFLLVYKTLQVMVTPINTSFRLYQKHGHYNVNWNQLFVRHNKVVVLAQFSVCHSLRETENCTSTTTLLYDEISVPVHWHCGGTGWWRCGCVGVGVTCSTHTHMHTIILQRHSYAHRHIQKHTSRTRSARVVRVHTCTNVAIITRHGAVANMRGRRTQTEDFSPVKAESLGS